LKCLVKLEKCFIPDPGFGFFSFLELKREHLDSNDFFEMFTETGKVSYCRPRFWSFFSFLELMNKHLDSIVCLEMPSETGKVLHVTPNESNVISSPEKRHCCIESVECPETLISIAMEL